jgi:hypothetical protein
MKKANGMKGVMRDLEAARKAVEKALEGLHQVTFTVDIVAHHANRQVPYATTQVTLWFGHEFSKRISGGDDILWLAGECRRVAIDRLAKLREVADGIGVAPRPRETKRKK